MLTFFHGWRRKVGCVTLVMACLFAGLWIRSQSYYHGALLPGPNCVFQIWSDPVAWTGLCWWNIDGTNIADNVWPKWNITLLTPPAANPDSSTKAAAGSSSLNLPRLRYISNLTDASIILAMPHWSIVIPLTLISAYLLLSKPRATPNQPVTHA